MGLIECPAWYGMEWYGMVWRGEMLPGTKMPGNANYRWPAPRLPHKAHIAAAIG